ncbi:PD-(D/E)XK nuclease-like transposase [Streptohalobacillus salinus]|uniref:PD-(D/E)XK nuclease-like transposase n=1 Tax=Streptohalobacillus salinus TaxID=621096 RepID=A0A2V3W9P4_9BACI|nr:PD-(D/E)XK nuclease family transposase [Streptohalobacillus salinus]PXW91083.1 PD-(D/E)XK nuclease-like transposase [Streptohalobacillus salinus]
MPDQLINENNALTHVVDILFCKVFYGSMERLRHFLNSVLAQSIDPLIEEITTVSPEYYKVDDNDSNVILKITAELASKLKIDVTLHVYQKNRNHYRNGTTPMYFNQPTVIHEMPFHPLTSAFVIKLFDFSLLQEQTAYHTIYYGHTPSSSVIANNTFETHYLELPKIHPSDCQTPLALWMQLINHLVYRNDQPIAEAIIHHPYLSESYHLYQSKYHEKHLYKKTQALHFTHQKPPAFKGGCPTIKECERIAVNMIRCGVDYHQIIAYTNLTEEALDELALKCNN